MTAEPSSLALALCQINPTAGECMANVRMVAQWAQRAADVGADLVIFPEMALVGYPPEDLVLRPGFVQAAQDALAQLMRDTAHLPCGLLVGGLKAEHGQVYNATFLIEAGAVVHWQAKTALPNYGVFDEKRTFAVGEAALPVRWRGVSLGLLICEEGWDVRLPMKRKADGAQLIVVQNASPFEAHKAERRQLVMKAAARAAQLPLVYVNMVGGQDELVFDGSSFAMDATGEEVLRLKHCEAQMALLHVQAGALRPQEQNASLPELPQRLYDAMVLALRDYVQKNGFSGVLLGLSGGIDSALSAAVAVDALGKEAVEGVLLPSPFTSRDSIEDAQALAAALGIVTRSLAIDAGMQAAHAALLAAGVAADGLTAENIQPRLRGMLLMALSNATGRMVLSTGNKSELAVGYATLYGDMCGGYNVLKDLYKTQIYALARWRNQASGIGYQASGRGQGEGIGPIPERSITKAPTAELREGQTDQDSLPPYEVLDAVLYQLIEERKSVAELVAGGMDEALVRQVFSLLHRAEYKRRQAAPGVKLSAMSFGRDWRMPMTGQWV